MSIKPYLIFNLQDLKYGIDANLVREIFFLPELTPLAETPIDIVGILNLRGKIVPIMHLDLRLGNPMPECQISDSIIVLNWENLQIGVIVNNVYEVQTIDSQAIEPSLDYGRVRHVNPAFIAGVTKDADETIILLNLEALIRQPDPIKTLIEEGAAETDIDSQNTKFISNFYDLYCPRATLKEKAIFQERAHNLRQATIAEISNASGQTSIAVLELGSEYFGIDLDLVREFINIRSFTPIPCCPKHIIGNLNLRGEVLTLVDIRGILNLPMTTVNSGSKAVVINVDEIVAGLPVDEILDVMYINSTEIHAVPVARPSNSEEYLRGTVTYREKILSLIDLPKAIDKGGLQVNENV